MRGNSNEHVSAERLQALLDGELPDREASLVERHLAGCARCASERDAWRVLMDDLGALPSHRPATGFAERVMADLRTPDRAPLAARVGLSVTGADAHIAAEVLQDYLDGALSRRRGARVESHLAACDDCATDADAWAGVIDRLGRLERLAPSAGFGERVMAGVATPSRLPWAARVRAGLGSLLAPLAPAARHLDTGRLQDYVEGLLPARQMARVTAHVDGCAACAGDADAWRSLAARLGSLERFEPGSGFSDRVMAAVRVPETVRVPEAARAPVAVRRPAWDRALAVARTFVPQTRRAWAAISGVAVTPAVTAALVLYAVFSHPTLTPSALASFLWWQVGDLASAGWGALSGALLQSAQLFGVYSVFEALAAAPVVVAGGVLLYSLVSALALRVLYRNVIVNRPLIANRPLEGRYVRASAS